MNAREAIKASMQTPDKIVSSYLGDLSDEELLARPVAGANHIAWQLGHLINSEHAMIEQVSPGSMPPLPDGFAEKYTKDTSNVDNPSAFHTKEEFLKLFEEQRAGTLKTLDSLTDDDLDKPAPESLRGYWPTVAAVFLMQPAHWTMHAGQWAVIRRKLGRPPLY